MLAAAQPQGDIHPAASSTAPVPYAPSGIPIANGFVDYFTLVNERDGGINGVKAGLGGVRDAVRHQAGRRVLRAAEGQESRAGQSVQHGRSRTPLIPKAAVDKVVVFSMGYGMTAAADGRWFPWVFSFPTTYWSQASAVIRYIGPAGRRAGKAQGQEDRPHLSTTAPTARKPIPPSRSWRRSTASS